jgi:fibronectin type 3 domain-containing protein
VKGLNRCSLMMLLVATLAPAETVRLTWSQSKSTPVSSNNVYRGNVSGGPYSEIFESTGPIIKNIDATVVAGETYCWIVTAVSNGIESPYSNESCVTVTTQAPSFLKAR